MLSCRYEETPGVREGLYRGKKKGSIEVESGSGLTFSNEIAFQKFSSLTGANCSDPGTGTKREQRGGAESDI